MDLKVYYQKIRDVERSCETAYPVIVSLETPDGGAAGVTTEAPVQVAAKMVVEGRARLANSAEVKEFEERKLEAKRVADHLEASKRMQVTVVSESELRSLKGARPAAKQ